jgi:hypothetical protein
VRSEFIRLGSAVGAVAGLSGAGRISEPKHKPTTSGLSGSATRAERVLARSSVAEV